MSEIDLEFRTVNFAYGAAQVLENASLAIPRNAIVCVVGPNGGGKSTLLKLALGLLKPQSGSVQLFGGAPERERVAVGYMPQYITIDTLFPITVREIVLMGRLRGRAFQFYSRADRVAAEAVLEELGLVEHAERRFAELSGGQKQRVLIGRALVNAPRLLLLDEPTAMVDAHIEAKLLAQLKSLHKRMTIVLVSHDVHFVSELVDRVICVNRQVVEHPLTKVADQSLERLYGTGLRAVDHRHCLGAEAGECGHD